MSDMRFELKSSEGILSEEDAIAYWREINSAWEVHLDRERIRKGLWKQYPAADQANQIKIKIDRVLRTLELVPRLPTGSLSDLEQGQLINALEELDDIINYSVFAKRILRQGNVVIGG